MQEPEEEQQALHPEQSTVKAPRQAETRGTSPVIYELFVLGELMARPLHGYKLHERANLVLGPARPLSWGTLYPLMQRLKQEGLTTSTVEKHRASFLAVERGQSRRIYTLTEAGRERFFQLMLTPNEYGRDTTELFIVKLTRLHFLSSSQRIEVLQWYRRYISNLYDYYQASRQGILADREVAEEERISLLQLIDYRQQVWQTELSWLDNIIAIGVIALLTVRGRKSGQPRTTPIAIVERQNKRYLVATFGIANWVHNLRQAGEATLVRASRHEAITAIELPPQEAAPILKECLAAGPSLARHCFDARSTSPLQEFEREVSRHPVFEIRKLQTS